MAWLTCTLRFAYAPLRFSHNGASLKIDELTWALRFAYAPLRLSLQWPTSEFQSKNNALRVPYGLLPRPYGSLATARLQNVLTVHLMVCFRSLTVLLQRRNSHLSCLRCTLRVPYAPLRFSHNGASLKMDELTWALRFPYGPLRFSQRGQNIIILAPFMRTLRRLT